MRKSILLAALLTGFLVSACFGQQIQLSGPTRPIQPYQNAWIQVQGITPDQAAMCSVTWKPETADVVALRDLTGKPLLLFESAVPGKYELTLTLNWWRNELEDAVAKVVKVSEDVGPRLEAVHREPLGAAASSLQKVYEDIAQDKPVLAATCVVEVAGTVPPPSNPKPPVEPPGPGPSEISQVIYVWEKSLGAVPLEVDVLLKQINKAHPSVIAVQFEKDQRDGDGDIPERYQAAHKAAIAAGLPCFVVVGSDGGVKVYKTIDEVEEVLP